MIPAGQCNSGGPAVCFTKYELGTVQANACRIFGVMPSQVGSIGHGCARRAACTVSTRLALHWMVMYAMAILQLIFEPLPNHRLCSC